MSASATRPKPLTGNMSDILCGAVIDAYRQGWNGNLRATNKAPSAYRAYRLRSRTRSSTIRALVERGMVKPGWPNLLTRAGVDEGEAEFQRTYKNWDDPDKTYTCIAEFVLAERVEENEEARKYDRDVARAKRLFRNLKISRTTWETNSKAMSAHIQADLGEPRGVMGGSVSLQLEDLLILGEQIEEMR